MIGSMRIGSGVLLLAVLACQGGGAPKPAWAQSGGPDAKGASPPPAPSPPAQSPPYFEERELRALAAQVKALKKDQLLVCGEAGGKNCVCLESLPCQSQGNCPTLQANVDAFRQAVTTKTKGRSVDCRRAEIGECGGFRYFDFEGDVARREMRWFDGSGRLVAQRNSTDYEEYCGGKSRTRFQGKVPRCEPLKRTELLCGTAEGDLPLPIEDVLKRRLQASPPAKR
jgi:hypothetical protein